MQKLPLHQIQTQVEILAKDTAVFIEQEISKVQTDDIQTKSRNSLVSYVDQEAERKIVEKLRSILPTAGFVTEEDTEDELGKELTWIIDPLDGTSNFLNKIPHFSVSIALQANDDIVLGVIYDVLRKECFSASLGNGFHVNGIKTSIGKVTTIENAMVVTGFPYSNQDLFEGTFSALRYFLRNSRGFRRLGSAALDMAYIAAGRLDIYYEANINAWDVAAGIIMIQEAGGRVCDFNQGNKMLTNGEIIATNLTLMDPVSTLIKEHFN